MIILIIKPIIIAMVIGNNDSDIYYKKEWKITKFEV